MEEFENDSPNGKVLKLSKHKEKFHLGCQQIWQEYKILKELNHENIISLKSDSLFQNSQYENSYFCGFEIEKAQFDLLNFIQSQYPKLIPIEQMKGFFKEIGTALKYLHEDISIAHNDIKLQNIFLFNKKKKNINNNNEEEEEEQQYLAKLADFGFSRQISDEVQIKNSLKQNQFWNSRNPYNLAPEVQNYQNQIEQKDILYQIDEKQSDIFQYGLAFYQSIFLEVPFISEAANENDIMFKLLIDQKFDEFWMFNKNQKIILKQLESQISIEKINQLKDLLQNLLNFQPQERPSISKVLNHPFFNDNDKEYSIEEE